MRLADCVFPSDMARWRLVEVTAFMERYDAENGIPWLAYYPRAKPVLNMWPAEFLGQTHVVASPHAYHVSDDEQREFMRDVRLGSSVNQHAYPNIHIALEPPLPPPHALQACTPPPVRVARHVVKNARFCIFKRRRSFRLGAGSAGAAEAYRLKCTSRALRLELCARE